MRFDIHIPEVHIHVHIHQDTDAQSIIDRLRALGVKIDTETAKVQTAIHNTQEGT